MKHNYIIKAKKNSLKSPTKLINPSRNRLSAHPEITNITNEEQDITANLANGEEKILGILMPINLKIDKFRTLINF